MVCTCTAVLTQSVKIKLIFFFQISQLDFVSDCCTIYSCCSGRDGIVRLAATIPAYLSSLAGVRGEAQADLIRRWWLLLTIVYIG